MSTASNRAAARLRALRGATLGILIMLVLQYAFGMWVNLYARLPPGGAALGLIAAYRRAVAAGPVTLTVHALLGLALLAAGVQLVVRAALAGRPAPVVAAAVGLAALLLAALAGSAFVGHGEVGASLTMALATAVATLSYVVILFVSGDRV